MNGKWHLASEPMGFDYYKYHISRGQQGFYRNPVYNENGKNVEEKGYATNLTTNFALDWLNWQFKGVDRSNIFIDGDLKSYDNWSIQSKQF